MDVIKFNHEIKNVSGALGIEDERVKELRYHAVVRHNKMRAIPSMDIANAIEIGCNDTERCYLIYFLGACNG